MNKTVGAAIAAALIAVSGCEVEQTAEGEMPSVDADGTAGQMPKYDVEIRQTQEAKMSDLNVDVDAGKLPEYKVEGPEVTLGTRKTTVDVPTDIDIKTEEKSFTIPDVDVDLPGDEEGPATGNE